ncbi:hypothetical protein PSTG_14323 [Puccinia striiformis f. sp. tritici PST-78]|uniref:Uncharacterized protein n=1 Tax=Puccinia striiformis f. sp. tritici PST-78 TaxID=1165861 RepID=A0A0L0UZ46_9BASI|nr:hypothetical protein PSTG_14323 [Puccinia striiformis f. sp. tritici PST-78]
MQLSANIDACGSHAKFTGQHAAHQNQNKNSSRVIESSKGLTDFAKTKIRTGMGSMLIRSLIAGVMKKDLRIKSESTLEVISENQSELDTTLPQIKDALNNLRSKSDPLVESSEREDDGHLEDFKGFRMISLDNCFRGLLHATTSLFEQSQKLI